MESVQGYIERITFQNPETGYTVAQLQRPGHSQLVCIVGVMPLAQPGETVRCFGSWKTHMVHGRQFEVEECRTERPADVEGIQRYLGSGLIKGIGPTYAKRIVERYGAGTLDIIDLTPDRLLEVQGIGEGRLKKIKQCWSEQQGIRNVMIFLQRYGVSPSYAYKIFRRYGHHAADRLEENPYMMARDIKGIGFKTADRIAQSMGHKADSPARISAGVEHVLDTLSDDGHVCYPLELFLPEAEKLLEVDLALIREQVERLRTEQRIIVELVGWGNSEQPAIWKAGLFHAEQGIARELQRISQGECRLRSIDTLKAIEWVQTTLNIDLAPKQQEAVRAALEEKCQVITGGPGTGKSTITNAILTITGKLTKNILLAAPTGRAAKRMTEITGHKASTLHGLLEVDFSVGGFKRNRDNPLVCDLLIVDEASMIDTSLMYYLLRALPDHARVIFVGDINQLPSVGPGNVLKDIIFSKRVPVTLLHEIFRQAAGSHIVTNAHRINQGEYPDLTNETDGDFFFIERQEPEQVLEAIVNLVTQRLPQRYKLDTLNDIQILAPMKRGLIGTENLNEVLQAKLNPKGAPLYRAGRCFKPGDKVMQIRNDYQKEVFNGDVGRIIQIDTIEQELLVQIDGRDVIYDFGELDDLVLAYAVSIHKYQGSECPCVVIPVHTTHFKMLHRNLLYTGITRGKKLVLLVGTKRAIQIAVRNDEVKRRFTSLRQLLMKQKAL